MSKRKTKPKKTMNAAVVAKPTTIEIQEVPIPDPATGEVRVNIEGCGVCASNLPPWEGREWFNYPMGPGQLGHEAWGIVDAVGLGVRRVQPGQRVAMMSDNSYAEYDITPVEKIVPLPEDLIGKPFPGEPLACAMNIFRRSDIRKGDTVGIVGIGFLGSLLTQLANNAGAETIAISRRSFSLEMAKQCGAEHTVLMEDHWEIIEKVKEITDGRLCDVVIEAVGKQWPLDLSAELVKEMGRLIIAGYHQEGLRQVNMQVWNWKGLNVINAHEREDFMYTDGIRRAIEAVSDGILNPWFLFTHKYPLSLLDQSLQAAQERPDGFMKALVMMHTQSIEDEQQVLMKESERV